MWNPVPGSDSEFPAWVGTPAIRGAVGRKSAGVSGTRANTCEAETANYRDGSVTAGGIEPIPGVPAVGKRGVSRTKVAVPVHPPAVAGAPLGDPTRVFRSYANCRPA